ncbi:MAG TPA: pantoate--beta-alanine ligase [Vicinamibacterales bacterium]|nr:pantoate--beta-alanine ligase [Vicinamibacterales bacterium]
MIVVRSVSDMRAFVRARHAGERVGFVPTMGALHEGHVSLMRMARFECEVAVASIFVNPTQFNDPADLARYPRPEAADIELAEESGLDALFMPAAAEMYRASRVTTIDMTGPALGFEGEYRPGHFRGVLLVCLKLFHIVEPDAVYLGQKDAQQVAVLTELVRDLDLEIEIRVGRTVREADGLAMSSRNARLSPDERRRALAIPRALRRAVEAHGRGEDPVVAARAALDGLAVDYVGIADLNDRQTLVVAASAGATRLIDNVPLDQPELAGFEV